MRHLFLLLTTIVTVLHVFRVMPINEGNLWLFDLSKSQPSEVIQKKFNVVANSTKFLFKRRDTVHLYFPIKEHGQDSLTNANALDTVTNIWYSKMLWAMEEPILPDYEGEGEVYRFTWLRTFDHPVVIRIEKTGNRIALTLKVSDGAGGYEPGKLITNKTIEIDEEEWNGLKLGVQRQNFWALPAQVDFRGVDGSEWILEATRKEKYHFTTRWSPSKGESYRNLCWHFVTLAKLRVSKARQY